MFLIICHVCVNLKKVSIELFRKCKKLIRNPGNKEQQAMYSVVEQNLITLISLTPRRATAEIAREFKDYLFDLIENKNIRQVVIDLETVQFMDSFFLGAIVSSLKKCRNMGGDIRLANMQKSLRPVFELMHLDEVFSIFKSRQEALESYSLIKN